MLGCEIVRFRMRVHVWVPLMWVSQCSESFPCFGLPTLSCALCSVCSLFGVYVVRFGAHNDMVVFGCFTLFLVYMVCRPVQVQASTLFNLSISVRYTHKDV